MDKDKKYNRRILGDATGEMGPFMVKTYGNQNRQVSSWYDDEAGFVCTSYPWFLRGGSFTLGVGSGVFCFGTAYISTNVGVTFRLILLI